MKIMFLDESGDHNLIVSDPNHPIFVLGGVIMDVQASGIDRKIQNLNLRSKVDNLAGLEIADALVTPIARMVLGRPNRIDTNIIKQKMRKSRLGDIAGYGLLTLPKE
jgi:hypothetical protein